MAWPRKHQSVLGIALGLLVLGIAFAALAEYKARPGEAASAPTRWPKDTALRPSPNLPTLLVVAHPRCPCTRATLTELARLSSRLAGKVSTHVVLALPQANGEPWEHNPLVLQARAIAGAKVEIDHGAREARRFGSVTSGQTLLYLADGTLAFAGGLTTARGHEGQSAGADRIAAIVAGTAGGPAVTPVFGCALDEAPQTLGGQP